MHIGVTLYLNADKPCAVFTRERGPARILIADTAVSLAAVTEITTTCSRRPWSGANMETVVKLADGSVHEIDSGFVAPTVLTLVSHGRRAEVYRLHGGPGEQMAVIVGSFAENDYWAVRLDRSLRPEDVTNRKHYRNIGIYRGHLVGQIGGLHYLDQGDIGRIVRVEGFDAATGKRLKLTPLPVPAS